MTPGHDIRCEVVGTAGSIAINGLAEGVASLEPVNAALGSDRPQDFSERFVTALRAELDAFCARCAGAPAAGADVLADRRALAIGVAARASAERRRPLAVGPDWEWLGPM